MRYIFLPVVGVVLGLGAQEVFAGITCDQTESYIPSAAALATINGCIEDTCIAGQNSGVQSCGSAMLTITPHDGNGPYDVEECVQGLRRILDQCIVADGTYGGGLKTNGTIYGITIIDGPEGQQRITGRAVLDVDEEDEDEEDDDEDEEEVEEVEEDSNHRRLEARRRKKGSGTNKTPEATDPKKTPEATDPKKTSAATEAKKKKKADAKKAKKAKDKPVACPMKKKKQGAKETNTKGGKAVGTEKATGGKKSTRDLVGDYLPKALSKALFRRTGTDSEDNGECADLYFGKVVLRRQSATQGKVDWWSFKLEDDDWDRYYPPGRTNPGTVMAKMKALGKLDVIKVKSGSMQVVGNPQQSTGPEQWLAAAGSFLLSNGGFFRMRKDYPLTDQHPIGRTSLNGPVQAIPQRYAHDYHLLRDGNHWLYGAPNLAQPIRADLRPNYKFVRENLKDANGNNIYGSLAHALEANERLAVAVSGSDKYIFAYTCALPRECGEGLTTDELRLLMDAFLRVYARKSITQMNTAINMDGGGSIYVAWKHANNQVTPIARGEVRDDGLPHGNGFPRGHNRRREVATWLKWT